MNGASGATNMNGASGASNQTLRAQLGKGLSNEIGI
jgi:hypothetical protein